jgi:histidinol-phosphate/aromatic aminotransferase/cobyric acid decarboxylase-like protein
MWYKQSKANFVFFREPAAPPAGGASWNDYFLKAGLILRPMGGGYLRVTLGKDAENRRFVAALKRGLKK